MSACYGDSLQEGDDVVVGFPSGREVAGRVEELVGAFEATVWVEDYSEQRLYPLRWLTAWGD